MRISDALEKGHGYARKGDRAGNVYCAKDTGCGITVKLKHRSIKGSLKILHKGLGFDDFIKKYGTEGWEPGM